MVPSLILYCVASLVAVSELRQCWISSVYGEKKTTDQLISATLMRLECASAEEISTFVDLAKRNSLEKEMSIAISKKLLQMNREEFDMNALLFLRRLGSKSIDSVPNLICFATKCRPKMVPNVLSTLLTIKPESSEISDLCIEISTSKEHIVRAAAAHFLGNVGGNKATISNTLLRLYKDDNPSVSLAAARSLAITTDQRDYDKKIIDSLFVKETRSAALGAIKELRISSAQVPPAIRDILLNGSDSERILAMRVLPYVSKGGIIGLPEVIELLNDNNDAVRFAAVETLVIFGPVAVPKLLACLEKTNQDSRILNVLDVFYNMGSDAREAIPHLMKLAIDKRPAIRNRALSTIQKVKRK